MYVLGAGRLVLELTCPFVTVSAANISNNTLPGVMCYHYVRGNFDATNVLNATILETGIFPNVTIGRTLLNDSSYVQLEANKSQVLVWTYYKDKVVMLNQAYVVSVFQVTSRVLTARADST